MKDILLSIKLEWWEKILTGEKTMEIRKSAPTSRKGIRWPVRVLCYVSGTGMVQGQFMCHGWVKTNLVAALAKQSRVPVEELERYNTGRKGLYGWIIQSPEKFDKPVPVKEICPGGPPMSWRYLEIKDPTLGQGGA